MVIEQKGINVHSEYVVMYLYMNFDLFVGANYKGFT